RISVSARVSEGKILIEVDDTGCGIPEEEQKNIFTEFYQLHNPERDRTKGLGLGLSIVNRLCLLLEHQLHLGSAVNKGTKFQLSVPSGNAEAISSQAMITAPSEWELENSCIIVIDDEAE